MATYYVQPNGADSNTGLGLSNATAWRTVQKALGSTGVMSGDTLYIAPGTYRETVTVNGTYTSNVNIIGDRTASQFSGISAGYIRITGLVSDALGISTYLGSFVLNGKSYLTFDSIWFEGIVAFSANTTNVNFIRCQITMATNAPNGGTSIQIDTTGQLNILIDKCYIQGGISVTGSGNSTNTRFNACFWQSANNSSGGIECTNSGIPRITMSNLTVFGASSQQIFRGYSPPSNTLFVYNCLVVPDYASPTFGCGSANCIVEDANVGYITRGGGVAAGTNSKQLYHRAFIGSPVYINPIDASVMPYTPLQGDNLIGAGQSSYSYGTDFYGQPWANPPSVGACEFKSFNAVSVYVPTERNQSSVEITAGQTSRSLYIYLGSTGITSTTSGLQAYYTKEDAAPVSISLVPQTTTGAWVSGGFAEVSATNQPGVYRLDIPNAAISAGYNQTVVTVRGASGTNGAVVVIQEPQPAGWQVRMGPFTVQADGVLTDERLKLYKGSIHSIDFKMVDQYGTGVDGTGTVVTANVYNSAGFLVDSYPCTGKYAEDGRYSFAIDATVTNVVGMYTINISRQIGSEINVFGRMKLEVLSP